MFNIEQLPLSQWVSDATEWLTNNLSGAFSAIQQAGTSLMNTITGALTAVPVWLMIAIIVFLAALVSGKKWGFPVFTLLGLLLIANQGLWTDLMNTVTLVLLSSVVSLIIGVPLGIWMAKSDSVAKILQPILDFMQTMPGFVYLIPAVAFFGIGVVPGVFASVIFALPPTVRMTNLGIRQVPVELVEAADSFGSTPRQKLFKLELPLAKNTIMAGVNQTIMLALSMVVIASMIGAPGLGRGVLSAVQRADIGTGFVNGLGLVILAIIIDRFTQKLNTTPAQKQAGQKTRRFKQLAALGALLVLIGGGVVNAFSGSSGQKEPVNLVYVEWDDATASTYVIGEVLKQEGFEVNLTPLDNAVMWQSVANGQADATVAAWLPTTHKSQWAEYGDQLDKAGTNLTGAKVGLVVPSYMDVDRVDQLSDEAKREITGIEPGAAIMDVADQMISEYDNLNGWKVVPSSSGAMATALGQAIKNREEIVITGWSPHWMFAKYDLKYLEDSKGLLGEEETVNTVTRKDLKQDNPEAYDILKNFKWEQSDVEKVMLDIQDGKSPEEAAKAWIDANEDKVAEWTK
jgi:glycine betaine/proline transport system substrate-binding protein